jgi:hypothetical protein
MHHTTLERKHSFVKWKKNLDVLLPKKKKKTLGDILKKHKKKTDILTRKNVLYKVQCEQCPVKYIGQTKQSLGKRLIQHSDACIRSGKTSVRALRGDKKTDNGLALHQKTTGHIFDFESVEVIEKEENYWKRIILEGIHIKRGKDLANLKSWYEIDRCWEPILEALDIERSGEET